MKERPILFSAPMVRAILNGSKTQTRRVVKPQPSPSSDTAFVGADGIWRFSHPTLRGPVSHEADDVRCPYGQPGDRLWVRETWAPTVCTGVCHHAFEDIDPKKSEIKFKADADSNTVIGRWRPSIHMPRWASRILLEITDVRVERLLEISEADAQSEGPPKNFSSWRDNFCALWQQINGYGSWDANPWVWAIEFKRVQP